jgi:MraZ protein
VFTGVHERQLDERGRVALPTTFRSHLGEFCYLTYGEDACVKVLSEAAFRKEAEALIDDVKAGSSTRARQRAFASSVVTVAPDKQGRIMLDQRLREYAGIGANEPVVVVGVLDCIEVWNPDMFATEESVGRNELSGASPNEGARP